MFGTAPGSFEPPTVDHRLVAFFAPSLLGRGGRDRAQDEPLLKCVHAWQARETEPQQDAEALALQLTKSTILSAQISTLDTSADLPSAYLPRRKGLRSAHQASETPARDFLAGHGVSLRVENGALTIRNGFTRYPQTREIIRYFRGDVALPKRIILLDDSGSISFDVLSWLAEQKVSFIRIDWKGDIVCVAGASGYSANPFRVRWQLETRENAGREMNFAAR